MLNDPVDLKFLVSSPARLVLTNVSGSVVIQPAEEDVIHVFAVKRPESGDAEQTTIECTQSENGTVSAITQFPDQGINLLRGKQICAVDYVVKVPTQTDVEVKVVSSQTTVTGIQGNLSLKTVSGDIKLDSISGSMSVKTVSGDIAGVELTGDIQVNSVSGDANFSGSNLSQVKAHCTSGDLIMESNIGEGPYQFHTVSGDVGLKFPQVSNCGIKLNTISGSLRADLPAELVSTNHGKYSVIIGEGSTEISMNSVSGDLTISSSEEIQSKPQAEISEIISKIDSGDLTVDQALEEMKG
jgi:DUF4097 and DUF4098 domain-containing protein YvlB